MSLSLQDTVKKLETYKQSPAPILSVYLEIPEQKDTLLEQFDYLVNQTLNDDQQHELKQNILYVRGFLEEYEKDPADRSLAIFSGGDNLFETAITDFRLPSLVAIDHSPFLHPLFLRMDEYQRYLIVLADREKAKFFTLYRGELEDQSELFNGGNSHTMKKRNQEEREDQIDHHLHEHFHRHFNHLADELKSYLQDRPVAAVLIGGHKEILHMIEKHLPRGLHNKVIATFAAEPDEPFSLLVERAKNILNRINRTKPSEDTPTVNI